MFYFAAWCFYSVVVGWGMMRVYLHWWGRPVRFIDVMRAIGAWAIQSISIGVFVGIIGTNVMGYAVAGFGSGLLGGFFTALTLRWAGLPVTARILGRSAIVWGALFVAPFVLVHDLPQYLVGILMIGAGAGGACYLAHLLAARFPEPGRI